ncbi:MAG: single-stranded DNA-binding protein [Clostridiales bacterium]|uniref:single-stranded DNA-binding protein n=1 Tax=Clostridium sp. N3C TaxID=1776758 RepID=UPI00092DECF1|nr:single-stranded DNA-binding protein [Clostridium sp. N3C]NLZ48727.1 single-stranded DNA-binding protein [Clostridiales bacterium]SCN25735.1 Helix-destabilizing protein [Clostridium sp. N3C]
MNRIVLIGRLTKDPEKRVLDDSGKVLARFIIAVEREYKNANGEREADFIPIIVWGKKAEVAAEYLTKGSLISVSGRLCNRIIEDGQGGRKYISEVVADTLQFLDLKKNSENAG